MATILVDCSSNKIDLFMPNISPKSKDSYLCMSRKLTSEDPTYITAFVPHAVKETAHHILVYGCENPGNEEKIWNCGEMNAKNKEYNSGPICRGKQSILYAWAMDAPQLTLPEDVAFKLGSEANIDYLVMQVHYANVDKFLDGSTDDSGISLHGQNTPVHHLAGVYFSVTGGYVNENSVENFESACEMTEDKHIVPFAYRTHTHKLGVVNTGYLVRNDPVVGQQWTEIGRRSPQLPQMFFPVSNNVTIHKGDIIASRCTIDNTRDHRVYIGATGNDEMCNFYIMYYTEGELLKNNVCFKNGPPFWYFNDFADSNGNGLDLNKIPDDISQVPAYQLEELKHHSHANHEEDMKMDEVKSDDVDDVDLADRVSLYLKLKKLLENEFDY